MIDSTEIEKLRADLTSKEGFAEGYKKIEVPVPADLEKEIGHLKQQIKMKEKEGKK